MSTNTAVLPVCRSPITSSRCPRPTGINASKALIPVCIGSLTLCRGIIPGAFSSTRRRSVVVKGPNPSIGSPNGSTTRPNNPLPTGTSTMKFVRFTTSPSFTLRSSPKITIPTLSFSKLSVIPRNPDAVNSTISPA